MPLDPAALAAWAPDFRAELPLYVESFVRAGCSRDAAEARAFAEWDGPAREAARQDAARARGEAFAPAQGLGCAPPVISTPAAGPGRDAGPRVAALLREIAG